MADVGEDDEAEVQERVVGADKEGGKQAGEPEEELKRKQRRTRTRTRRTLTKRSRDPIDVAPEEARPACTDIAGGRC